MLASIRVLADEVINQIAAGEVIERPASVVKELVENSLDAGARHVTIEIEDGGKTLVRVVDDGCGMSRDELHLALRRHATSKLRAVADLLGIGTFGFRGEALPSIASVSRLRIASRSREASGPGGWAVELEGGAVTSEREVGVAVGTRVEVRDLLYNLPARQKFMKGDATETGHITDCVNKLALANPGVHLRLRLRDRTTLDAPRCDTAIERAQAVLHKRVAGKLVATEASGGGVSVRALLGAPGDAQRSGRCVQLFVGRRPVRDRGLLHAVTSAYGDELGRGRYPVAVVFVDVQDEAVDVNVHPQKLEVRFADPQSVYAVVKGCVERGIESAPWRDEATSAPPIAATSASIGAPTRAAERLASYAATRRLFTSAPRIARAREPARPRPAAAPAPIAGAGDAPRWRYLGQLDETLLVCESRGDLVLIDAHIAAERIELGRLLDAARTGALASQRLLFPERLELAAPLRDAAAQCCEALGRAGFDLDVRRPDAIEIVAVPAALAGRGASVLLEILADLPTAPAGRELDVIAATIACHTVGETPVAGAADAQALLEGLADAPRTPRHERRTIVSLRSDEIARRFG